MWKNKKKHWYIFIYFSLQGHKGIGMQHSTMKLTCYAQIHAGHIINATTFEWTLIWSTIRNTDIMKSESHLALSNGLFHKLCAIHIFWAASPLTPWPSLYRWTSLEWSPLKQRTSICSALRGGDNWQRSSACPPTAATKCLLGMVTVQFSVEEDRKPGYMWGQQLLCCYTL